MLHKKNSFRFGNRSRLVSVKLITMRLSRTLILFFLSVSMACYGQLSAPASIYSELTEYPSPDPIFYFSDVQSQILSCQGPDASEIYTFTWSRHNPQNNSWSTELQTQNGNSSSLLINEPGGYQVRVLGPGVDNTYRCWAFAPELYETQIEVVYADCFDLDLRALNDSLPLYYYNPVGGAAMAVKYGRVYNWTSTTDLVFTAGAFQAIDAPVEDTQINVQVSDKFGRQSSASLDFTALAVQANYLSEIMKADVPHEIHSDTEGSAPIEVRFSDESKGNITGWEWRFGDSGVAFDRNPFFVFTTLGKDTVSLRVINQTSGCESVSEENLVVNIVEYELAVPNVFTPNGDGQNDEFRVVYRSLKKYSIVIYNRWGRKVYESTNPAEGWDGTVGGGLAPPGVYFYYIEAESYNKDERIKPLKGPVHLIRGK